MAVKHDHYKFIFITASLPKRLRNGRFNSKTAVRWFQKRNRHLDPEVGKNICWNFEEALWGGLAMSENGLELKRRQT